MNAAAQKRCCCFVVEWMAHLALLSSHGSAIEPSKSCVCVCAFLGLQDCRNHVLLQCRGLLATAQKKVAGSN